MSLNLPARRVTTAVVRTAAGTPSPRLQYLLPRTQRRNAFFGFGKKSGSSKKESESLPFEKEMTRLEREKMLIERNADRTRGSSIFDEEIREARETRPQEEDIGIGEQRGTGTRMKEHMERGLDPDPRWRVRFLKKKVMQMVRDARKPITKAQRIKRSEKEHTSKSVALPTSTKKLVFLSHQIVGKTVDEAITQMRFSKKKMAREVKYQLEEARDTAISAHGMGLGAHNGQTLEQPKKVQTKDGRWIEVKDPTLLYVDQSWVTKGFFRGVKINHHGRSRMSRMWRPTASISLVLKEEKTRIRQHEDRLEAKAKKAPWVHLPNRPVTAQRPYYSW
ncbi:ribosomal protein L22 [Jackrogersella minutella]|nr:ribosomal protein L22 [Jackrogersella minutella]